MQPSFNKAGSVLALLCAVALCACAEKPARVSVLMISIDTLRVDALGCYGNEHASTPSIDRLAEEGTLFENAMSQAPATGPSFSSILTSKYPQEHGVVHSTKVLESQQLTMAEIFKDAGYRTGAFVSCSILSSKYGFSQGFDVYDEEFTRHYSEEHVERDAAHATRAALDWLAADKNTPFLLWLHYFDAHAPYERHAIAELKEELGEYAFIRWLERERSPEKLARYLPTIKRLYADEVSYVDEYVGRVISALERNGRRDNTLVVLNADHGEELFDHDFFHGHFTSLYQPVLHVPLIFSMPKRIPSGKRIPGVVETIDVLPTVLSLAGIPGAHSFSGYDLSAALEGVADLPQRIARAQREPYRAMPGGNAYAAWSGGWKFIYFAKADNQLFDLVADPEERSNLLQEQPKRARVFERDLKSWISKGSSDTYVDRSSLEVESLKALRSLGYIQ